MRQAWEITHRLSLIISLFNREPTEGLLCARPSGRLRDNEEEEGLGSAATAEAVRP